MIIGNAHNMMILCNTVGRGDVIRLLYSAVRHIFVDITKIQKTRVPTMAGRRRPHNIVY